MGKDDENKIPDGVEDDSEKDAERELRQSQENLRRSLNHLVTNFEILEQTIKQNAILLYARYKNLTEAGFTKEDAMNIIIARGLY